jgi:hypothetical protein
MELRARGKRCGLLQGVMIVSRGAELMLANANPVIEVIVVILIV